MTVATEKWLRANVRELREAMRDVQSVLNDCGAQCANRAPDTAVRLHACAVEITAVLADTL